MNIAGKSPLDYSGDTPNNDDTLIFNNETGCWTPSSVLNIAPVNSGSTTTTDQALVRWEGTGGQTIQNSNVTLSNTGVLSIPLAPLCAALTFYQIGNSTDAISLVANTAPSSNITITLPTNVSDTICTGNNSLVLTNKTLQSPTYSGIGSGVIQSSTQPVFSVYMSANQTLTGNGATITVPFNAINIDNYSAYSTTQYNYTAPVSGNYLISAIIGADGFTGSENTLQLGVTVNSGNIITFVLAKPTANPDGYYVCNGSMVIPLTQGWTIECNYMVGGDSTDVITLLGGQVCLFMGYLLTAS